VNFYTLVPLPAPRAPARAPVTASFVQLERVQIPGEIDHREIVRRVEPTQLDLAEQDQWAAPIDELIYSVLVSDLEARLPGTRVGPQASSPSETPVALSIDLREFVSNAECEVSLQAAWMLTAPDAPPRQGLEDLTVPHRGTCSTGTIPEAMSNALAALSDRIAAVLTTR
jgi:uncharacterized lipoprotein YmbA